ncbi:MAG TPA: VOC family protein [Blastocatellia bacterium]|jgi:catechol 2,3-dioxygenase-like lactoylglutathione lyase family enzyme
MTKNASAGPQLYRVILPARDIAVTAAWYEELFQMKGEFVGPNRFYLHCGPVVLALVEPPADTPPRPNQEYVYFAVSDLKSYHERAARLDALDSEMGSIERRPWGEVSFYARDPLGNPLCFVDGDTLFTGSTSR